MSLFFVRPREGRLAGQTQELRAKLCTAIISFLAQPDSSSETPTHNVGGPINASQGDDQTVEQLRRKHIKCEASIKSVGLLWLFLGAIGIFVALGRMAFVQGDLSSVLSGGWYLVVGIWGVCSAWIGLHVRRLTPKVRPYAIGYAILGLAAFPIGTMLSVYALVSLLSQDGKFVMSDAYAEVRSRTPKVRHRTSIVAWIVVAVVVGFWVLYQWIASQEIPRHTGSHGQSAPREVQTPP